MFTEKVNLSEKSGANMNISGMISGFFYGKENDN